MALAPTTAAFHRHIDLWFDHAMCGLRADCYPTRSRYARLYGLYRRDLWHWRDWQYPWYAAGDADSEAFQPWADYHWLVMGLGVVMAGFSHCAGSAYTRCRAGTGLYNRDKLKSEEHEL